MAVAEPGTTSFLIHVQWEDSESSELGNLREKKSHSISSALTPVTPQIKIGNNETTVASDFFSFIHWHLLSTYHVPH